MAVTTSVLAVFLLFAGLLVFGLGIVGFLLWLFDVQEPKITNFHDSSF